MYIIYICIYIGIAVMLYIYIEKIDNEEYYYVIALFFLEKQIDDCPKLIGFCLCMHSCGRSTFLRFSNFKVLQRVCPVKANMAGEREKQTDSLV
jgi:hypothetical protein